MSVDRRLFINSSWSLDNIVTILKSVPEISDVNIVRTTSLDYTIVALKYNEEQRQLNVHNSSRYGGFNGTLLTLGAWGESEAILTTIAERIGGLYTHVDSEDVVKAYDYAADGNLDFMLRYAVLRGKCDGRNVEDFVKDHEELTKSWAKNNEVSA